MKYLYGAAVQGIQDFIFRTKKLKDIVGASEIVEQICTEDFKKFLNNKLKTKENTQGTVEKIIAAAGNIKLLAENKDDLKEIVRNFPKHVQTIAPGISISQAVVIIKEDLQPGFAELEKCLKTQRNKRQRPPFVTALGIENSRKTGLPAVDRYKNDLRDLSARLKSQKAQGQEKPAQEGTAYYRLTEKILGDKKSGMDFPLNLSEITNSEKSNWLAVIHADGNNLGKVIQKLQESDGIKQTYKTFSENLETSNIKAARKAFEEIIEKEKEERFYPFRPIILGGDDLTVICRADLAIPFTKIFLQKFENETEKKFAGKGLTACAGIAFAKEKYPFHYAADLAEQLCSEAKKISKSPQNNKDLDYVPASLLFHKIQSSFVDSFDEIKKRELRAQVSNTDFCFGPYALKEGNHKMPIIDKLEEHKEALQAEDFPTSSLREWLSELHKDENKARSFWDRILQINKKHKKTLDEIYLDDNNKTIVYDLLSLISLEKGGENA